MKEYIIDHHSTVCILANERVKNNADPFISNFGDMCERNPSKLIFFAENDFWFVSHHDCIGRLGGRIDFVKEIINAIYKKSKTVERYDVGRMDVGKDLVNLRKRGIKLKKYIEQVNYIYYNNAGRGYAITTTIDYMDKLCNNDELRLNFEKTKKYLIEKKEEHMIDELISLFNANYIYVDETEVIRSIDHFVKEINLNANK